MKKVKIQKSYFDTFKWTSGESETTFFCANSKSKFVASVDGAYASNRGVPRGDAQDARASPLPPCASPPTGHVHPPPPPT